MTRYVTVANGLLFGAIIATSAWGQDSTRPTLADRMSAMRRSWTTNEPNASADEQTQTDQTQTSPAPGKPPQQSESTGTQNRSLIPNWLGHRNQRSITSANTQQPANKMQAMPGGTRNSAATRQMPPDPAITPGTQTQADWLQTQSQSQGR